MERAPGLTLNKIVASLELTAVQSIFKQLVATVGYLHENGVCHRDLRPDNIVVEPSDFKIILIDFNVAVTLQTPAPDYQEEIKGSTGLKEWTAPETRKELYYSAKCDMWSLGCLLQFLLDRCKKDKEAHLLSSGQALVDGLLRVDPISRFSHLDA